MNSTEHNFCLLSQYSQLQHKFLKSVPTCFDIYNFILIHTYLVIQKELPHIVYDFRFFNFKT
jgi:hypothetical protein